MKGQVQGYKEPPVKPSMGMLMLVVFSAWFLIAMLAMVLMTAFGLQG